MNECNVTLYAVLGDFRKWQPVKYIIEDYVNNMERRAVFGITTYKGEPRVCKYKHEHGCEPFSTPVAEFALALHKMLHTRCNVHLTFFTPLSLLERHISEISSNSIVNYDKILEETKKLVEELGEKINTKINEKSSKQEFWLSIRDYLKEAKIYKYAWSPMEVVVANIENYFLINNNDISMARFMRIYFVPIPVVLNRTIIDNKNSKLLIFRTNLDFTESIASVWISAMLRRFKPNLAVLDTTHGVNYVSLLIDKAFKHATEALPFYIEPRVQVYNTDPVVGGPSEDAIYKYHLLDDRQSANISILTRSPPNLATVLEEYANRKLQSLKGAKELNEEIRNQLDRLLSILRNAIYSFNNDVILWGFILTEGAQRVAERLAQRSVDDSWLELREEVSVKPEGNIKTIIINQYPALIGDEDRRNYASPRARLQLVIVELLYLLKSINSVWNKIKNSLEIRRIEIESEDIVNSYNETRDYIDYLIEYLVDHDHTKKEQKLYIIYCDKNVELHEHDYPKYFPIAPYILLQHELKELKKSANNYYRSVEDKKLKRRHFIAHAGLEYGIVTRVLTQEKSYVTGSCYKIEVNLEKLKQALNMI